MLICLDSKMDFSSNASTRSMAMIIRVLAGVGMSTITGSGPVIVVEALSFFRQALSVNLNFNLRT